MTEQRFGECDGYFRRDASGAEGAAEGPADRAAIAHFRRLLARHPAMAARHSAARLLTKHAPEALLRGIVVRMSWWNLLVVTVQDLSAAVEIPFACPLKSLILQRVHF